MTIKFGISERSGDILVEISSLPEELRPIATRVDRNGSIRQYYEEYEKSNNIQTYIGTNYSPMSPPGQRRKVEYREDYTHTYTIGQNDGLVSLTEIHDFESRMSTKFRRMVSKSFARSLDDLASAVASAKSNGEKIEVHESTRRVYSEKERVVLSNIHVG